MERQANYALVGALSVVLLLGSLVFVVWLAQFQFNRKFDNYRIIFQGPVSGLSKGGEVQLNGIEVGEITSIRLDPVDSNRVITDIQLEHDTPVRADLTAQAVTQGITGVKYIQISPGSPERPMLRKVSREKPPVIVARRSRMEDLVADLPQITKNAASALEQVNRLLSDQNIAVISRSLDDVGAFTAQLRDRKQSFKSIDSTFAKLERAATELERTTAAARIAIGDKDQGALAQLTATLVSFRGALDNAQTLIGRMDGPTNELATTTVPSLNAALVSIEGAADALTRLTSDIRQDPKATLFRPSGKEVEDSAMTILPIRGLALAAALLLAGCLGGGGKADLYRFGAAGASGSQEPAAPAAALTAVSYPGANFSPPASGDRILTIRGMQASYIAKARWVSPAPDLFDAATIELFETRAPGLRLVRNGDLTRARYLLLVDVRRFEAHFTGGKRHRPRSSSNLGHGWYGARTGR